MIDLEELNFAYLVTKVDTSGLDKLIDLADSEMKSGWPKVVLAMDKGDKNLADAYRAYLNTPSILFPLLSLAIVHCYSIVENNRKLVCQKIPGSTDNQKKNLHDVRVVTQCLGRVGIAHKKIRCYKTMDEFREVNNAVKHARYGSAYMFTTESQKKYGEKELRSLYSNRARHLKTYLSDLYQRVEKHYV